MARRYHEIKGLAEYTAKVIVSDRKDCNTQYVLQRTEKTCTHQERDTGR